MLGDEELNQIANATVDGAALLTELRTRLEEYVILPSPEAVVAVVLYIAATHAQPCWEHAPRLVIKSPLKRCGKTRLMEFCMKVMHAPQPTTNISTAALVRLISPNDPPTIILDEADTIFKDKRSEKAEDIRGILNSGHSRGFPYIRWDMLKRTAEYCPTFAMAVIGGIGDMPDTIEDRAVVIKMRRRAPGETVKPWRARRVNPIFENLRDRLEGWFSEALQEALKESEPTMPVEDRAADVWEPLIAIADAAGGEWPELARQACKTLTNTDSEPQEGTPGEQLLGDLREVFGEEERLTTNAIRDRLNSIEEAPWGTWHRGDPLSARGLANLLRPYGVRSKDLKLENGSVQKGYTAEDLAEAWMRYLPTRDTE